MAVNFETSTTTQFTFKTSPKTLTCVYQGIASRDINIWAVLQLQLNKDQTYVKLVPGFGIQTPGDIENVRDVLKHFHVKFSEQTVLQVIAFPTPGQLSLIQSLLVCRVKIIAIYLSEDGNFIIETCNLERTRGILENASTIQPCPVDCDDSDCEIKIVIEPKHYKKSKKFDE